MGFFFSSSVTQYGCKVPLHANYTWKGNRNVLRLEKASAEKLRNCRAEGWPALVIVLSPQSCSKTKFVADYSSPYWVKVRGKSLIPRQGLNNTRLIRYWTIFWKPKRKRLLSTLPEETGLQNAYASLGLNKERASNLVLLFSKFWII